MGVCHPSAIPSVLVLLSPHVLFEANGGCLASGASGANVQRAISWLVGSMGNTSFGGYLAAGRLIVACAYLTCTPCTPKRQVFAVVLLDPI